MALDPSEFTTRTALADYSIRYGNEQADYISEDVFTPAYVDKTANKKYQYDLKHLRQRKTRSHSKAMADKVDYGVFTTNLTTALHKLAAEVDPHDERDADAAVASMEQDAAQTIMDGLLISREIQMAAAVATAGSYPAGLTSTLGAGAVWSGSGGDPEGDVKTAKLAVKAQCGVLPNAMAVSYRTLAHLVDSAALKDRLKYTSGQSISVEQIKNLLGLKYLHVCGAVYNNSIEGAADSLVDVWDDFALIYVKNPTPGRKVCSYGNMFIRNNLYTYSWLDEARGSGDGRIKMLEMGWEYELAAGGVISASDGDFACGYYLDNVY